MVSTLKGPDDGRPTGAHSLLALLELGQQLEVARHLGDCHAVYVLSHDLGGGFG